MPKSESTWAFIASNANSNIRSNERRYKKTANRILGELCVSTN